MIAAAGPEPVRPGQALPGPIDHAHYVERVLRPIADQILEPLGRSFDEALGCPETDVPSVTAPCGAARTRAPSRDLGDTPRPMEGFAPMDPRRRSSDPRRRAALCAALVVALAAAAAAVPSPGGPAVRLPEGEFASDAWDLVARFESGHLVFSQAVVTNLGWGDHKAAVVGLVVTPDEKVQVFRRSEDQGDWKLSRDGLRMDLRSIVFDRGQPMHRLDVGKDEFELGVEWKPSGEPVWPAALPQRCPIEVQEIDSDASGSLWSLGMPGPTRLERGHVALTHRWTADLEAACLVRRTELFVLESDVGLYFTEIITVSGEIYRWVALRRDGRVTYQGAPQRAALRWKGDASGYPTLAAIELAVNGVELRGEVGQPFYRFDLLDRVAMPFRNVIAARTSPRLLLARASLALEQPGAEAPGRALGAVVKVDYTNPMSSASEAPHLPAPAPGAGG